jgi:hypothetical protein
MKRMIKLILILSFIISSTPVFAQKSGHSGLGLGIRGGMGLDPDQFVVGAQFSLGKKWGITRIVPSVDFGFGDNVTTIDFNADFLLRMIVEDAGFGLYGGGGPTLALWDFKNAESEWKLGLSAVVGIQLPLIKKRATNIEARFGIGDNIPDLRILLAIIF